jgi:hypothetical protein
MSVLTCYNRLESMAIQISVFYFPLQLLDKGEIKMFCSKCGGQNTDGVNFCNTCGSKIIQNAEQSVQSLTPEQSMQAARVRIQAAQATQYNQPVYQPGTVNAPGKNKILVVGILYIVFGAILFILSFIACNAVNSVRSLGIIEDNIQKALLFTVIASILGVIVGIICVNCCNKEEYSKLLIGLGIIDIFITVIVILTGFYDFSFLSLIDFVLPIILIVGASQNNAYNNAGNGRDVYLKRCGNCNAPYSSYINTCPQCGYK